jgi:hypothetical protein
MDVESGALASNEQNDNDCLINRIIFYAMSFTMPVYYLYLIVRVWMEEPAEFQVYFAWAGVYATIYFFYMLYMFVRYPKVIFNFSFDGVWKMNTFPQLVVTSVAHYYVLDMLVALFLTFSTKFAVGWKIYRMFGLILIMLWGPIGWLFSMPVLIDLAREIPFTDLFD